MPKTETTASQITSYLKMITDKSTPEEMRVHLLKQVCSQEGEAIDKLLGRLLKKATSSNGQEDYTQRVEALDKLLRSMQEGPLRQGTFLSVIDSPGTVTRALILFSDGSSASCVLPDEELAKKLRRGDSVWVESQGKAVLSQQPGTELIGEEARLERRIDATRVEISQRDEARSVYHISEHLADQLEREEIAPGDNVIVCPQRRMAFSGLPKEDGLAHYRFLSRDPIPDVSVKRDIGSPPRFIADLDRHVEREMTRPELGREYRLQRSRTMLLTGVSGSGKTYSIHGFIRQIYETVSALTGVPIDELPPRVVRVRMSEVLSHWLGQSDQNLDRLFDEIDELAEQTFVAPDGSEWELPLLVVAEEIDGLARARGEDAIHDRIQTTLLQRLDSSVQKLRSELVVFLFTSNVPHLIDSAFLRRAGGQVQHFGRLDRRSFLTVLDKHLDRRPFSESEGATPEVARKKVTTDIVTWLFSPNSEDDALVELTYVGTAQPDPKRRRDFLTAGLVDRAVQSAAQEACQAELEGQAQPGLTSAGLMRAIDHQVDNIVRQLEPQNTSNYLTLPEGMRVGAVRRLPRPSILPVQLERAS